MSDLGDQIVQSGRALGLWPGDPDDRNHLTSTRHLADHDAPDDLTAVPLPVDLVDLIYPVARGGQSLALWLADQCEPACQVALSVSALHPAFLKNFRAY
ncbi:MAG: hypothetical protein A2W80_00205 [Candidatus Riflebacteria bacterium GWC2_50_8]|nr:MAG: hypothetical protein A2W80_00205 [Candidatus Riflebacteria bacterium GWC2_50_8]